MQQGVSHLSKKMTQSTFDKFISFCLWLISLEIALLYLQVGCLRLMVLTDLPALGNNIRREGNKIACLP